MTLGLCNNYKRYVSGMSAKGIRHSIICVRLAKNLKVSKSVITRPI